MMFAFTLNHFTQNHHSHDESALNLPLPEVFFRLASSPAGLSREDAAERLERYGPNVLAYRPSRPPVLKFLSLFLQPLVLLLVIAGLVSGFLGELRGAIMIAAMVLLSVALQFFQEYQSEETARKLARQVAVTAAVIRDGVTIEIPTSEVVPGDAIHLGVGDIIPADARVLSAKDFFVDQSVLTGESLPVEKTPCEEPGGGMSLPDMHHAIFSGSHVVSGTADALVTGTGAQTEFGRLAGSLDIERPETEFQRGIREFTSMLLRVIAFLVTLIFGMNVFLRHGFLDSLLFAVAVSVGITPELLPMILTINLSAGAAAMARRKVIVKHLQSIQNLGSMDVLCTDKTGTLTEGHLKLREFVDASGCVSQHVLQLVRLNSIFQASLKNPMDSAIAGFENGNLEGWAKVDEVPFDFTRRRMSVIVEKAGGRLLVTKGAPERVLDACRQIEMGGTVGNLTPDMKSLTYGRFLTMSAEGYRAVAVAYRPIDDVRTVYSTRDETDLIFAGYVSFVDPPKPSAEESLRDLKELGVAVKILTGDNELVTRRICDRVGLDVHGVLTGQDLDGLSDDDLGLRARSTTVFARLSPEQKNRIIGVLKRSGHVVGYMGDGVNDTPSLHAADVGISVNNAVDVAKEAADIVLLEEGLHILKQGIVEGRRTFANTMKYIMMGTSSNFGNMFSVPVASLLVPFLPMLPVQILLNSVLYDFSQASIPTDRVDEDSIKSPRRWDVDFIRRFMLVFGPISSIYDIMTYIVMLRVFHAGASLFQTGWFIESLATQTLVIHVIRSRHSPFRSGASGALWLTTLAAVGVGILIPYTPLGVFFGFTPLPLAFFAVLSGMVAAYLMMVEAVKKRFYISVSRHTGAARTEPHGVRV